MGIFDGLLKPITRLLRQPVESFIRLETADGPKTLASEDGSLITLVKVDGARQIIGDDEYQKILSDCVVKLGTRFDRPGHAIQVYFSRNPERIQTEIRKLLRPNFTAARNVGLDIDDIFEERAKHLSHYLAWEEIYFVLWTRPGILSKSDMAREAERSRSRKWVKTDDAQYPFAGIEGLRTRHRSFVSSTVTSLHEMGIQAAEMEVHDALAIIRANLLQQSLDSNWRANLPGDKIVPRAPEHKGDMSEILWPTLRQQLTMASARVINNHCVEMGKYLWAGVDMTLGPTDPIPFPQFLARMTEAKAPFRISFLIEGGGIQGMAMQSFLSSIFAVTNAENKQVKDALEALNEMSRSEPIVKLRVSFATWAPRDNMDQLEDRLSALTQAAESWGYAQVSHISGDPLDQVMSSALAIHCASTAPAAVAPLYEVMKLMPWQRASSPFEQGAILLRTPDGRVWPYQTGTNVTTTWFDLVFAQPGGGKSVLMNTLNLGTCLTAGVSQLPFIAVIDIGPSSAGLVSLLKDALPPHRRQEVTSFRLQMTNQFAINPFDTKLGMRTPQVTERSFLIELIILLCTPPGQMEAYDGIAQLAGMVVDEMFRWRDDNTANAEPRPYLPRIDQVVDDAIREHELSLPAGTYWWDVVDMLFDKGATYAAGIAQRYAMPTLGDAVAAARRPQIKNLLEETSIGASSEGVIHAFERMITSAVREFPILASVTKFSLNENRICALDLADVCPAGDAASDRQTAVMYMLARHALVTPWWINEEALAQMAPKYRVYHEKRLREFAETPKRLCYDEFHRTSKTKSVRAQIVRDVREGRKRGIQIILASQMLDDFDDDMVDLATGVWVLGTAISDGAVQATQDTFGLTDTARWIIRHKLTGPKAGGAPALLVLGTVDGKYEQHLINTLGPLELWAFSTTAEDVAVRNRLYTRLGAAHARRLLGANFPGGSARNEIKRRIAELSDKGDAENANMGVVIDKIVEEMVALTKVRIEDIEELSPKKPAAQEEEAKKQSLAAIAAPDGKTPEGEGAPAAIAPPAEGNPAPPKEE
jgi:intracellular multiplication protein IcmB